MKFRATLLALLLAALIFGESAVNAADKLKPEALSLGDRLYTQSNTYDDGRDDTGFIIIDVYQKGFEFSVVAKTKIFSCAVNQYVIQDGRQQRLTSIQTVAQFKSGYGNFIPFQFNGCEEIQGGVTARGRVFMRDRMKMDPSRPFDFRFASDWLFSLRPDSK